MDKIKKLFSTGEDKGHQVNYGTPEPENIHADGTSGQGPKDADPSNPGQDPSGALTRGDGPLEGGSSSRGTHEGASSSRGVQDSSPAQLQTDPAAEKDPGIMRQILNPGGNKYDETRYGTTAHSDKPLSTATTGTPDIGGPGSSQIESQPAAEDSRGIARQVLNPGGGKYDEQRYGETGTAFPGTESRLEPQRTTSAMSIKSGMPGPYAGQADEGLAGGERSLPDRTAPR
ncbi:hypothetical protein LTR53_006749 [Teratosphaeriaceae sp. CCFEE 6253]|nr:hypothetical protein LTR53_006749 [Teratosphaeriaceae sp. CCFEE 6253]